MNKKIFLNNLIILIMEALYFISLKFGFLNNNDVSGATFYLDFSSFLTSQIIILLIAAIISFRLSPEKPTISKLFNYYLLSIIFIPLVFIIILALLPAPPIAVIILVILVYILICFIIATIQVKTKKPNENH